MQDDVLKAVARKLAEQLYSHEIYQEAISGRIEYVERMLRDMGLGKLLAAGEIKQHTWYSCPKNDEYMGNDDRNICVCGKDAWDAAKAKVLS